MNQSVSNIQTYSHSQLQAYRSCPLRYYYTYEVGLVKRQDESAEHHIRWGQAIHDGLKHIYLGDTLRGAQEAFLKTYPHQLDENDKTKTRQHGTEILADYVKTYMAQDKANWRVVSCEAPDICDDGFVCHLDLVIEDKRWGGYWGVDHKGTGSTRYKYLGSEFWKQFSPNSQINEYARFITERYGDFQGFIINAIGVGYRQKATRDKKTKELLPAGTWHRFQRQSFNPTPDILATEAINRQGWIEKLEHDRACGVWGYDTGSCFNCTFHTPCSVGYRWPQDQDLILLNYRQTCGVLTEILRPCALDIGHTGEHSEQRAPESDDMTIEVE